MLGLLVIFCFLVCDVCGCMFDKFSSKSVFVIGKTKVYKRGNTKISLLGKLDKEDANEKL